MHIACNFRGLHFCAGALAAALSDIAIIQRGQVKVGDMHLRRFATIYRQGHAGDERGIIGGEKADGLRDFFPGADTLHGNGAGHGILHGLVLHR